MNIFLYIWVNNTYNEINIRLLQTFTLQNESIEVNEKYLRIAIMNEV